MSKEPTQTSQPTGHLPLPGSRRGLKGFFSEVGREMRKVNWPQRSETNRLTGVVLALCVVLVTILFAMHTVFHQIIEILTRGF